MNELIIMLIILCLVMAVVVSIRVFANLCWVIHRKVYKGKMSRTQYVSWFLDTVWE